MSRIRSRNTKPETVVRSLLHRMGYRFRLDTKIEIPAHIDFSGRRRRRFVRPDIVLPKHRAVIFVHGCYWHRHEGCPDTSIPKSRTEWWEEKFALNVARDRRTQGALEDLKWNVIVVWECETSNRALGALAEKLDRAIRKTVTYEFRAESPVSSLRVAEVAKDNAEK